MHCYNNSGINAYKISDDLFEIFLKSMKHIKPNSICFSGGEPFTHEHIFEYIDKIKEYTQKVYVATNGVLLNDKTVLQKLKSRDIHLQISIDGMKNTHNSIRGEGNFEKTIDAMTAVKEYIDFNNVTVKTVVTNKLTNEINEYISFLDSCGVKNIAFGFLSMTGRAADNSFSQMVPSSGELIRFQKILNEVALKFPEINIQPSQVCLRCGLVSENPVYENIKIDVFGNVYLCQGFGSDEYSIGKIDAEHSLAQILDGKRTNMVLDKLRSRNSSILKCKTCLLHSKNFCTGGCVADGINTNSLIPCCDERCELRVQEFYETVIRPKINKAQTLG